MRHLSRMPNEFNVSFEPDEDGYLGRECPNEDCVSRYFKITPGTGIECEAPCHCPYCGHAAGHDEFFTSDQIEYAQSIALNAITGALLKDLKAALPRSTPRPSRGFGLQISFEVKGRPHPVHYYQEKELETEVVCDSCGLRYAIYGLFGWCPDCGAHNSLQILEANLAVAGKKLAIADSVDPELAEHIVADALQTTVSAFDAFGREVCRAYAEQATSPEVARSLSFQSIGRARAKVQSLFTLDFAATVTTDEWDGVCRTFQKRHLFAHRGGVVDQAYLDATNDRMATLGRKVPLSAEEVTAAAATLRCLGRALVEGIAGQTVGQEDVGVADE